MSSLKQLLLDFAPQADPGYVLRRVWDHVSRQFIEIQSMLFTGPGTVISIVPDRAERTSPIYDLDTISGMSVIPCARAKAKICACGCGLPTPALRNGGFRTYIPGHNLHTHWRGRHV